jgi:hypothetical protein
VPPLALTVPLYATPTVLEGNEVVVIEMAPTLMLRFAVAVLLFASFT